MAERLRSLDKEKALVCANNYLHSRVPQLQATATSDMRKLVEEAEQEKVGVMPSPPSPTPTPEEYLPEQAPPLEGQTYLQLIIERLRQRRERLEQNLPIIGGYR